VEAETREGEKKVRKMRAKKQSLVMVFGATLGQLAFIFVFGDCYHVDRSGGALSRAVCFGYFSCISQTPDQSFPGGAFLKSFIRSRKFSEYCL